MPAEFFPYRFQPSGVTLKVKDVSLDGRVYSQLVRGDAGTVDLTAFPTWTTAEVEVDVEIASSMPESVLPKGEQAEKPWRVVVTAVSLMGSARQVGWRQSERLAAVDGNNINWSGKLRFNRSDTGVAIRLRAFVTRAQSPTLPLSGYANEPSMRLAQSEEWIIQIDPKSIPPGKAMRVDWVNFKTSQDARLNKTPDSLYFLDLDQDMPILYLNEDIQDFKAVLTKPGHTGSAAAIRDTLFRSIAQPVWLTLALVSATSHHEDESERPEWQQSVLKQIAPRIYPEESAEVAVEKLLLDGRELQGQTLLLQRLIPVIENYLELKKTTTRLFKDALRSI